MLYFNIDTNKLLLRLRNLITLQPYYSLILTAHIRLNVVIDSNWHNLIY